MTTDEKKAQSERLRESARAKGYTNAAKLAVAMGLKEPTVRSAMNGTRALTANSAEQYAKFLHVGAAWLLYGTGGALSSKATQPLMGGLSGAQQPFDSSKEPKHSLTFVPGASGMSGPKDLPILGYVRAGVDGFFINNGEVQGYTVRPENLVGVSGAYSVYVHEASMFPAFEPGHLVWVDPVKPAVPGDSVIIQLLDGQSFLKRLKRRTEKAVICEQWNPAGEVKYDTAKVKTVHLVVGQNRKPG
jgi:phage repressor protein C with HTH and peptisase S24 domain